jgi:hypothetical protein
MKNYMGSLDGFNIAKCLALFQKFFTTRDYMKEFKDKSEEVEKLVKSKIGYMIEDAQEFYYSYTRERVMEVMKIL